MLELGHLKLFAVASTGAQMILDPAAEMGLTFLAAGGVEQELTFPVAAAQAVLPLDQTLLGRQQRE